MGQNKQVRIGPVALTNTLTTNILNSNVTSLAGPVGITLTQPKLRLKHIRISNKTAGAVTFSLWIGATGANAPGTEFMGSGRSVPANSEVDWYGDLVLESTDFLVGGASANTSLTLQGEAEVGF